MKKIKAHCLKCDYEWDTKSPMIQVSCPCCGNKVTIRDISEVLNDVKD